MCWTKIPERLNLGDAPMPSEYRAPTGLPEDWGLPRPPERLPSQATVMLRDDDSMIVCEIGGEAKIYHLSDLQIANLAEQFAKRLATKFRVK